VKVSVICSSFHPAVRNGGITESDRRMCEELARQGVSISVVTSNADGFGTLPGQYDGWSRAESYRVYYGRRWFWRDLSPGMAGEIFREVALGDVIHVSGTFNWFLPLAAWSASRWARPLVVSPHGSLLPAALNRRAVAKEWFSVMFQRPALRRVAAFCATSRPEGEALRRLFPASRVEVIPAGVDVPVTLPLREGAARPYLLFLGRLHPFKRVERIIRAFACAGGGRVADRPGRKNAVTTASVNAAWCLLIAGEGERGYRETLEETAAECGVGNRVRFLGNVAGEDKTRLLAQAEGLVLASYSENFGMSVVESLAHGTPCVVANTAPWERLDREGCGFCVDDSEEALADGIGRLMMLEPGERHAMGMKGREWMKQEFSWSGAAEKIVSLYASVIDQYHDEQGSGRSAVRS